jgi:hypothetical protein
MDLGARGLAQVPPQRQLLRVAGEGPDVVVARVGGVVVDPREEHAPRAQRPAGVDDGAARIRQVLEDRPGGDHVERLLFRCLRADVAQPQLHPGQRVDPEAAAPGRRMGAVHPQGLAPQRLGEAAEAVAAQRAQVGPRREAARDLVEVDPHHPVVHAEVAHLHQVLAGPQHEHAAVAQRAAQPGLDAPLVARQALGARAHQLLHLGPAAQGVAHLLERAQQTEARVVTRRLGHHASHRAA